MPDMLFNRRLETSSAIKAVVFDLYETLITEWVINKYTSNKCADELGVDHSLYREIWDSLHWEMNTGICTCVQALEKICAAACIVPSEEKLAYCMAQRISAKNQCFEFRHDEILQMLDTLKKNSIKLALCSNCSADEVSILEKSALYGYFAGTAKPANQMYRLCTEGLGVLPSECLYVGDGGSRELYGAVEFGMRPIRAMWFLNKYATKIEPMRFEQATYPSDITFLVKSVIDYTPRNRECSYEPELIPKGTKDVSASEEKLRCGR